MGRAESGAAARGACGKGRAAARGRLGAEGRGRAGARVNGAGRHRARRPRGYSGAAAAAGTAAGPGGGPVVGVYRAVLGLSRSPRGFHGPVRGKIADAFGEEVGC